MEIRRKRWKYQQAWFKIRVTVFQLLTDEREAKNRREWKSLGSPFSQGIGLMGKREGELEMLPENW